MGNDTLLIPEAHLGKSLLILMASWLDEFPGTDQAPPEQLKSEVKDETLLHCIIVKSICISLTLNSSEISIIYFINYSHSWPLFFHPHTTYLKAL